MPDYGHVGGPSTYLAVAVPRNARPSLRSDRAVGPGQITLPKMITADSRLLSEVFTLMLLTVCAKGSEQLRTTQNKTRFCSCGWLILVVRAKLVHTV